MIDVIEQLDPESKHVENNWLLSTQKQHSSQKILKRSIKISVNLPSQLIISKITTFFDKFFDQLSMNSRIEVEKFEPGPTFEKTIDNIKDDINEIKDNHLK